MHFRPVGQIWPVVETVKQKTFAYSGKSCVHPKHSADSRNCDVFRVNVKPTSILVFKIGDLVPVCVNQPIAAFPHVYSEAIGNDLFNDGLFHDSSTAPQECRCALRMLLFQFRLPVVAWSNGRLLLSVSNPPSHEYPPQGARIGAVGALCGAVGILSRLVFKCRILSSGSRGNKHHKAAFPLRRHF